MSQADLVESFKLSLHDSISVFTTPDDDDFKRMLDVAAQDFGRVRPRTLLDSITLVADQDTYAAPANILGFKSGLWGMTTTPPWDKNYPGKIPDCRLVETGTGMMLHFLPAPTDRQIYLLGSEYKFYYYGGHVIGANAAQTSIPLGERGLLLLRAQAEAMREMAMRNIAKPVQLRDGISGTPRNGTPASVYRALMDEFESRAC